VAGRLRVETVTYDHLDLPAGRGIEPRTAARRPDLPAGARRALGPQRLAVALLPYQRLVGNAAVARLLRDPAHPVSQLAQVQRQADLTKVPAGLSCPVSTSGPAETGTAVIFANGGAVVSAELDLVILRFVNDVWGPQRDAGNDPLGADINVDGYGSTTGSQEVNWRLSSARAEAVRAALVAHGVPASKIHPFAHGETNVFHPEPLRNQRVMISPVDPAGFRGAVTPGSQGTAPGLGARKAAVRANGGQLLDVAVAMLETEHMLASDYPLGDGKTGDAANFGIFKQNWHFIRISGGMPTLPGTPGGGLREADFARGAELNSSLNRDVQVLQASQRTLGLDQWFAAHRFGETGQLAFAAAAKNTTTEMDRATLSDVAGYQSAVEFIHRELIRQPLLQTDDRKVFVRVPAI